MVTDIESFGRQCRQLMSGETSIADMNPFEPELRLRINSIGALGHLNFRVEITPDHLSQHHTMEFEIDQSYLPRIIKECAKIVDECPVRGQSS